jgi:hypothetical protein
MRARMPTSCVTKSRAKRDESSTITVRTPIAFHSVEESGKAPGCLNWVGASEGENAAA